MLLLQMAYKIPCILPINMDLLSQSLQEKGMLFHSNLNTLRLAAWKLSGRPARCRGIVSQRRRVDNHNDLTTSSGTCDTGDSFADGVLIYSVISENLNTTGFDFCGLNYLLSWVRLSGRVALITVFLIYLVLVSWIVCLVP